MDFRKKILRYTYHQRPPPFKNQFFYKTLTDKYLQAKET